MKKINTQKFLEFSEKAIHAYCLGQRISSAAQLAKECAEKMDEEHDYEEAIKYYEKMAELYLTDEQPTSANQALTKVADLYILTRDYSQLIKAIKVRTLRYTIYSIIIILLIELWKSSPEVFEYPSSKD